MNRRELVVATAAAPLLLRAGPAAAADTSDAAVVSELLRGELVLQKSYEACTMRGPRRVRTLARRFLQHEFEHIAALAQALEALGAPAVPPPRSLDEIEAEALSLGVRRTLRMGRLRFLIALEEAVLERMLAATGRVSDENLLQTVTTVLGCQAQHLVVLRAALP